MVSALPRSTSPTHVHSLVQPPSVSVVVLHNIDWETLERLDLDLDRSGARLTFLDGILEIMAPLSEAHAEPGQLRSDYLAELSRSLAPELTT
jgi:Uma2 family endonuclease